MAAIKMLKINYNVCVYINISTKKNHEKQWRTFFQHADFETLHEAAGLARLASPLGDLALVGRRTAVLDVAWCVRTERLVEDKTSRVLVLH